MKPFIELLRENKYGWVKPNGDVIIARNNEYHDSIGTSQWFKTGGMKFRIKDSIAYITVSSHPGSYDKALSFITNEQPKKMKITVVHKTNTMKVLDNREFFDIEPAIAWLESLS